MPRTPEEIREGKRLHMERHRAKDPDAARAYQRAHHEKHRERHIQEMRDYYARRFFWGRAMKLRGEGRASTADLARLWKKQRGHCALTGERLTRENAHLDHITAKARGGSDQLKNLRWVTRPVNLAKRDLTDAEFFALCSAVLLQACRGKDTRIRSILKAPGTADGHPQPCPSGRGCSRRTGSPEGAHHGA